MTDTALYARVSTRGRDQDPETQLLKLRAWAAQAGHSATEYVDRDRPGRLPPPRCLAAIAR